MGRPAGDVTSARLRGGPSSGLAALLTAVVVVAVLGLMRTTTFDAWGALLVLPVIVVISVPILRRQAVREGDPRLLSLLLLALGLKLAGAVVRHYVAFTIYGGVADAAGYHDWGVRLSEAFRQGDFQTGLDSLTRTDFIRFLTGIVYTVTGPTRLGGFLVYSWLGFWGLFLFYRAFTVAVPQGRTRSYRLLVLFLPSLVFWPSSIGKEAWMMFTLGVGAFGAARVLAGHTWRGFAVAAAGLGLASVVRPHVAGLMGLALVGAFILRRSRAELQQLAPLAKVGALAALVVVAAFLVVRTDRFLKSSGFERPGGGVTSVLTEVRDRTQQGGSEFAPSIMESPIRAPVAAVTVMFRPLLVDAHNTQALVAGYEGTFLLLLSLVRFRWLLTALGSIRRQPYVAFAVAYCGLFVFAFSSVANFGIVARERVQLLPLYLVLLSIPPPDVRDGGEVARA